MRSAIAATLLLSVFELFQQSSSPMKSSTEKTESTVSSSNPSLITNKQAALWLEDAQVITSEIEEERGRIQYPRDALIDARLAQVWFKSGDARVGQWISSAKARVTAGKTDSATLAIRRLNVGVEVAQILLPLRRDAADEMIDSLLHQLPSFAKLAKTPEEKNALQFAIQRLNDAPFDVADKSHSIDRQYKITSALIHAGQSNVFVQGALSIYSADAVRGNDLVTEALDAVESGETSPGLLFEIQQVVLPGDGVPAYIASRIDSRLVQRFYNAMTEVLQREEAKGLTPESCREITPLRYTIERLPKDRQQLFPAIDRCLQLRPSAAEAIEKSITIPDTPEGMLEAATKETDPRRRAQLKFQAALGYQVKDNWKVLEVLDGFTEEERRYAPPDRLRDSAEQFIVDGAVGKKDYGTLQVLLSRSPEPALTALRIADRARRDDKAYALSMLPVIRKLLEQDWNSEDRICVRLLRTFSAIARPEIPVVVDKCMREFSNSPEYFSGEPEFLAAMKQQKERPKRSSWEYLEPAGFPNILDLEDQRLIRMKIDEQKYPSLRVSLRLWVLKSVLDEYTKSMESSKQQFKR